MIELDDLVAENIWPARVRKLLNKCALMILRPMLVQFSSSPDAPQFMEDDGKILLILPTSFQSGGNSGAAGGFKCEASGSAIRVYFGAVNSLIPSGMSFGDVPPFIITPGSTSGVVCLSVTVGTTGPATGIAQSANVGTFASVPSDAEPVFYLIIGSFDSSSGNMVVSAGGMGNGVGDQSFELCGLLGGTPQWGPA